MIGRLVSLILLSTLSVTEMNEVPQQISLTVVKFGDNVTLTCALSDRGLFYWYKLNFGYMVQTVTGGSFDNISFQINNSRFSATKVGNVLSLNIRNVSKEDEATYFCQAGSSFSINFINGTILAVNDPKTQHKFFTVKQTPDVNSVHLGDTMTLQCSLLSENKDDTDQCPDEDKVHWFKGVSESHPGIIYHGSIKNKEDGRCDYSLSKTITNSSDAGTYYCAVVTCGEILFGKGTKVEIEEFPLITVLGALLTCSVLMNFALILTRKKIQPRKVEVFTDVEQDKSSRDQMSNEEGEEVGLNYVALDFPSRKSSRWKSKKESPESTIYSGIREGQ
ncbi:carboxyl-terminal PDZ ligand of neuronal nitric oxide synthase protein [Sarotherodon galilaeus]